MAETFLSWMHLNLFGKGLKRQGRSFAKCFLRRFEGIEIFAADQRQLLNLLIVGKHKRGKAFYRVIPG